MTTGSRGSRSSWPWADACAAARSASEVWVALDVKESYSRGVDSVALHVHADDRSFRIAGDLKTLEEADALARRVEGLMEPLVGLEGRMLVRLEGEVEVDHGGRYTYEDERKLECVRAALHEAFGDEADAIRVSGPKSAPDSRIAAVFHVPAHEVDAFSDFLANERADAPRPR